jgi:hypothetical protein
MRLPKNHSFLNRSGYALIIAMCFLSISLIAYTSMMYWVSSNAKITKRNNLFVQSQAAAESATESVVANMMRDFNNQSLGAASSYSSAANLPNQTNWPIAFTFSDTNGNANSTSVSIGAIGWTNLPARYAGLFGLGQPCVIASQATPLNMGESLSATVCQNIWFGSIPIFQFAIFYNVDLEINPGKAFTINGRVHSNKNIYATGSSAGTPLTFTTNVEASLQILQSGSLLDPQNGPNGANRTGNVVFNMAANNPLNGAASLSMPIGTNNDPAVVIGVLGIPPVGTDPKTDAGQSYVYNKADIIISNSAAGNLSAYYFNQNITPNLTPIAMDVTNVSGGVTNTYYSFATNVTFYDYRETSTVKAVQVDVSKFGTWLTNNNGGAGYNTKNNSSTTTKNHDINGIYVYNNAPISGSQLPAVRVVNGAQLPPAGLTVATPFPLYVKGDYNIQTNNSGNQSTSLGNTAYTRHAALMGDAVTVLSANWDDTYAAGLAASSRLPVSTTINAACMEGIVPSDGNHYSGGLENFLRLLEGWSTGTTLTYNGSIVVLFDSQYATNSWGGNYYSVPTRAWGFDKNFNTQSLLPPMTPQVRVTIRNSWTSW